MTISLKKSLKPFFSSIPSLVVVANAEESKCIKPLFDFEESALKKSLLVFFFINRVLLNVLDSTLQMTRNFPGGISGGFPGGFAGAAGGFPGGAGSFLGGAGGFPGASGAGGFPESVTGGT